MHWDYEFINKIERRPNNEIWFHKGNEKLILQNTFILDIKDEKQIINPTFLQKYRYIVINDNGVVKLLDNEVINDVIYTDNAGRMAFHKNVEVLSYF